MDEKETESFKQNDVAVLFCGSYRHLVAECKDSWENMVKRKVRESNMKLRDQFEKDKLKGEENRSME